MVGDRRFVNDELRLPAGTFERHHRGPRDFCGLGHFVNTISTAGIQISPTMAVYAATKNAVRTLSEGLRLESDGKYRVTGISPGFVGTNFAESMTDPGVRAAIQKRMDEIALEPEAIARAMAFAIEQPDDVDVGDIVVRPTVQG